MNIRSKNRHTSLKGNSTYMKKNKIQEPSIVKENMQYLWYILAFALGLDGLILLVQLLDGQAFDFTLYKVLITLSMVFIPLTTVNIIYFFKKYFLHHCQTKSQILLLKVIALFVGVSIGTVIFELIFNHLGFVDDDYIALGSLQFSPSTTEVITNNFIAAFVGIPIFLRQQVKENSKRELEQKTEQLEKVHQLNIQSQLEALQAKVNPHFLYNSLNSIASLIHVDPNKAEQMVLSLSELFRYSLNNSNGQLSTVAKEVKMVETYLSIESIRFGDNLTTTIDVAKGLEQVEIPRFLLQPMVENAIKHGTSKILNGKIELKIFRKNNDLIFTIADNGPDFPTDFDLGYGIKCVSDQLELLYKNKHSFSMLNKPKKKVEIILQNIFTNV